MMNGAATGKRPSLGSDGYDGRWPSPSQNYPPTGKTLVDGYRKDILASFEKEKPLYNPMNPNRPQSSALVDLNDPIQVHLLTETALSDSRQYEILSQEEVDDLKKQVQTVGQRIEQTKANLAIQSKYRDAAISMAKLYSPSGATQNKRRSLLGNRLSGGDYAREEAELERQASERRCEELAAELFTLEKRLMDPQKRLLQHTAGILQMTHRPSSKKGDQSPNVLAQAQAQVRAMVPNGIPGSPESLYTYSNGRNSLETAGGNEDDAYFDDRSLYLPLDELDGQQSTRSRESTNAIQIPMESPVRERNNQLREETDRLREENSRLANEVQNLKGDGAEWMLMISDTERKLGDLNQKLWDLILSLDPEKNSSFNKPPSGTGRGLEPGEMVGPQLDYLEKGLAVALTEQLLRASELERKEQAKSSSAAALAENVAQAESRIELLNRQLNDVLRAMEPDYPSPPEASGKIALGDQLDYLQDALRTVQTELSRATELASSTSANKQKTEQAEAVLMGLWDIIQAGYADIQQRRAERCKARAERGIVEDDDEMSGDEHTIDTSEPYSLQAFSTKVQWLYTQATKLKEQKAVLKRQIKQQRELNNKSGSEKDLELKQKTEELERTRDLLDSARKEARDAQEELAMALGELETLQRTSAVKETASLKAVQNQLEERSTQVSSLEASRQDLLSKLSTVEGSIAAMEAQLQDASEARRSAEERAQKLQQEVAEKDAELDRMNVMVVELKTESTIAKAELEGAYGSRAQRAAEAAALSKSSEKAELNAQVQRLKQELATTLKELEDITQETIAAEREKLELENKLDDAISAKKDLENEVGRLRDKLDSEVANLKEQLDKERLRIPGSPSSGAGGTGGRAGAAMLSEQFRATMKEERKKFQEALREEQAKRRRLEDELRQLRRSKPNAEGWKTS